MKKGFSAKNNWTAYVLWGLIVVYALTFSGIAYLKYRSFSFHDMDLAAINQTFWNAAHGRFVSDYYGEAALLSGHKWFIIFPLLPLYALFPGPLTLLFLQSLALGLGGWAVYLLGRELLNKYWGLLFAGCYLLYPALNYVNLFEFHIIAFATPLLLFTFYYYQKRSWGLFLLFVFLSLSVREDVAIPVFGIGLFALLQGRREGTNGFWSRYRWGLIPLVLSVCWFAVCNNLIPSLISKSPVEAAGSTMVESFYGWLNGSPGEIVQKALADNHFGIFRTPKLKYMYHLLVPLAFLSLLSPSALIMVVVSLAEGLLSSRFSHYSIRYQYSSIITPFIFIAAIFGLRNLLRWRWLAGKEKILLSVIIIFSLASAWFLGPLFRLPNGLKQWRFTREDTVRQDLVDEIPARAKVIASFEFGPSLSMRPQLFLFYHLYASSRRPDFAAKIPVMQEMAEYALLDFNDWLTFYDFYTPGGDKAIYDFLTEGDWRLVRTVNSLALFERGLRPDLGLVSVVGEGIDAEPRSIPGVPQLKLAGVEIKEDEVLGEEVLSLRVDLKCVSRLNEDLLLSARFINRTGRRESFQQILFAPYRIYPTSRWKPGDIIRQRCDILVPAGIPPGSYDLILSLIKKRPRLSLSNQMRGLFYNYFDTAMVLGALPSRWGISPDRMLEQKTIAQIPRAVTLK